MDISLKKIKNKFFRFWRSDNGKIALIRDVFIALVLVLLLLTALWAYTGQWFGAPMVAIESSSMRHDLEPFGRFGTINAGDMVLLVNVEKRNDIVPYAEAKADKDHDNYFYGMYGDVLVYRPYGDDNRDQIIHRAMCWVGYNGNGTYTVEEYGLYDVESIKIRELGLDGYTPSNSGFITKGDNNEYCDQRSEICKEPVKVSWVSGKARGELPWVGTINLFFNDLTSGKNTVGNVPTDCIMCLVILVFILVMVPVSLDLYDYYKSKKGEEP